MTDPRRDLPGVDRLLSDPAIGALLALHPRSEVVAELRAELERVREALSEGDPGEVPPPDRLASAFAERIALRLEEVGRPSLGPVLNATGVILHTNLGRAPLAEEAIAAVERIGRGYTNLEFDLGTGARGSRYLHAREPLARLTGAEDALVVNNAAGALVLALTALAGARGVVVSRGELVEIGGGFRLPEVIAAAGVPLREVGTTNRTILEDYRSEASRSGAGALLKVHRSNFRVTGFTEEVAPAELAGLGAELGIWTVHDLGSGLLLDPGLLGLPPEPTPGDSIRAGVDLVIFSGDKLLGGPQAGLIAGRRDAVERLRRHPLCRALRVDRATLAALEATLALYRDPERARDRIPVLRMLALPVEELEARAAGVLQRIESAGGWQVEVVRMEGRVGGGTFPEHPLPSAGLRIRGEGSEALLSRLRGGRPTVIGRIEKGALLLDLRTLLPGEEDALVDALSRALGAEP